MTVMDRCAEVTFGRMARCKWWLYIPLSHET